MKAHRTAAKPLAAAATAAAALLLAASGASAATFNPTDGASLVSAIAAANTNGAASNTIVLADNTFYSPAVTSPIQISNNLTITSDHSAQDNAATPLNGGDITGANLPSPATFDFFQVTNGATVSLQGVTLSGGGDPSGGAGLDVLNGTLELDNSTFLSNNGTQLMLQPGTTATLNNSSIIYGNDNGIAEQAATLVLNNTSVSENALGGITTGAGSVSATNSLIAKNNTQGAGTKDCNATLGFDDDSVDDDGTCGFTAANGGVTASAASVTIVGGTTNGGPTETLFPKVAGTKSNAALLTAGDPTKCSLVDQRFFVRGANCEVGSYQANATQETTAPACGVAGTPAVVVSAGPPKTQTVTSTSPSGFGDYPFTLSGVSISNGTVASPTAQTPASLSTSLSVTATKTDQTQATKWSFSLTDWAGLTATCA